METKMMTTSNKNFGTTSRCALTVALVIAALLMAACGTELHGKYSSLEGSNTAMNIEIEFKPGNKANYNYGVMGLRGPTTEVDYEVRGKEVLIKIPQSTLVGTITDDGCLDFSSFGKLCKQVGGRTLSGTYLWPKQNVMARNGGHFQIEFKSGNKANWSFSMPQHELPALEPTYEIHGEEVTFRFPNATTKVATITDDDGCLDFGDIARSADGHPSGYSDIGKLCKQIKK